jgi:hypothetical protein
MAPVQTSIEYLQKSPLYEKEKPDWCFLPPGEGFDPDKERVDNLEWEAHPVVIENIREAQDKFKIDHCGFEVFGHESRFKKFQKVEDVSEYRTETELMLKEKMHAVYAKCYDSRLRRNVRFERDCLDLNDPLLEEGPARGAHNGNN